MSNIAGIDDYRWLTSAEAAQWLAAATEESRQIGVSTVGLAARLRKELSPARARLVLEQVELRSRATEKFDRAASMFFAPTGLEQATDELIAAFKGSRFSVGTPVADLCCGIGGDAVALARRGPLLAIDRDPVAIIFTEANLRAHGITSNHDATAKISNISATGADGLNLEDFAAWHLDPDRRPAGRRTTRVELHDPGVDAIQAMLTANPNAAIKLAPAAQFNETWWLDAELEWLSRGRQCRQLVAWFGALAQQPGRRRATVIGGKFGEPPHVAASFAGRPDVDSPIVEQVGAYVFEPDPAVLAAKLAGVLAEKHHLAAVAGGVAYFTADHFVADGALSCFEVLETMPYDRKRLRAWLAKRQIGRLEIKKRGVPLDPERVRRDLHTGGQESATILLARISGQTTAIISRRVLTAASPGSGAVSK